ncbi:MAG: glutamyl-tRNA(Gln) amidotransferase subunit [Frankiales bacterium]|nr:glutamyl-tRNA(Gln) amidotransferase subunit [Frankiales bacterium]
MSDPADLTLVELLPLLASRALSARELLDACLANVERHEQQVQAFVVLTPERARTAAERADAHRAAGRPVGELAGVPVAVKDLYLTAGTPTTASSRVLEGHDPGLDAEVWTRLQRAGAGLLGKTTMHEFAYGTGSIPTRNPWGLDRTPGGSSGGSGAALAARMAPVATGTDTGGSLRIPAGACGLSSLRPAQGRVSTYGVVPLSPSLDTAGPMARRMLDVSLLLRLLAGHDPRDPGSLDAPVPAYPQQAPRDLAGVRIGVPSAGFWDDTDADVDRLCAAGLELLAARGAELVEVVPPSGTQQVMDWPGTYGETMGPEAVAVHAQWLAEREHLYGEEVLGRLRAGQEVTPEQYEHAQQHRRAWAQAWRALFASLRLDAVAHPTNPQPPALLPGRGPSIWPSKAWSVTGFPALSVPVGVDVRGLPVGLSLAALPEQEASLVGLGVVVDEEVQLWQRNPLAPA